MLGITDRDCSAASGEYLERNKDRDREIRFQIACCLNVT